MLRIGGWYKVSRHRTGLKPALFAAAAFFFSLSLPFSLAVMAADQGTNLAVELLAEGNSSACIVECKRILASDPKNETAVRFLAAAESKSGKNISTDSPSTGTTQTSGNSRSSITAKPAQWMILFYRSQIRPAIGQRCSLTPSCSEYGMQALKKHGILGLAMIGDRTFREPDVVTEKLSPVRIGNRWFYKDTLESHDWWMKTKEGNRK